MRVLVLLTLAAPAFLIAQDKPHPKITAIRGAKIYTGVGAPLDHGVLLIEGGKISAAGKETAIPPEATVLDAAGKVVVPGLIDAASRLFLEPGDRGAGSAEHSVLDSIDRFQELYKEAVEQGVTTVYVGPPSFGPVNGLGAVLHLDRARSVIAKEAALKLSIGFSPQGDSATVAQRYESYVQAKQAFEAAKQYGEAWTKYRKDFAEWEQKKPAEPDKKPQKPKLDPRNEVLLRALDAKQPLAVRIEAHTVDAIGFALKLIDEFKLHAILEGATEAYLAPDTVKRANVPVVAGPVFRPGQASVDFLNHSTANAAALVKAGVPIAIGSFGDEGGGATRFLTESAALAASNGLTREQAIASITSEAARILGIEKTHGSIEKGKSADLVLLSGEPFEAGTVVEKVLLGGEIVFQRKGE
jgi:imidazolonepropionase-like amidohydrolase